MATIAEIEHVRGLPTGRFHREEGPDVLCKRHVYVYASAGSGKKTRVEMNKSLQCELQYEEISRVNLFTTFYTRCAMCVTSSECQALFRVENLALSIHYFLSANERLKGEGMRKEEEGENAPSAFIPLFAINHQTKNLGLRDCGSYCMQSFDLPLTWYVHETPNLKKKQNQSARLVLWRSYPARTL